MRSNIMVMTLLLIGKNTMFRTAVMLSSNHHHRLSWVVCLPA